MTDIFEKDSVLRQAYTGNAAAQRLVTARIEAAAPVVEHTVGDLVMQSGAAAAVSGDKVAQARSQATAKTLIESGIKP